MLPIGATQSSMFRRHCNPRAKKRTNLLCIRLDCSPLFFLEQVDPPVHPALSSCTDRSMFATGYEHDQNKECFDLKTQLWDPSQLWCLDGIFDWCVLASHPTHACIKSDTKAVTNDVAEADMSRHLTSRSWQMKQKSWQQVRANASVAVVATHGCHESRHRSVGRQAERRPVAEQASAMSTTATVTPHF